ncbi:MAG TPA: SDR family oxidoreductase [Pyrinomonadaceae bacterium]|jgi:NAD(P)-dependent dehydrogenase (short-subunit alcohol dehydrogenase family)/acyl dehydratase|nr:SDR family oxidoreductase [Pyrinomonadaceae bacterium]
MSDAHVYTAEDLHTGLKVAYEQEIAEEDVLAYARLTGDRNPLHVDADYARASNYEGRIVHGAYQVGLASALLGMRLPGQRVLLGSINSRFPAPLYFPTRVKIKGEITAWNLRTLGGQLRVVIQEAASANITAEIFMGFTLHEQRRRAMIEESARPSPEAEPHAGQRDKLVLLTGAAGGLGAHILAALAGEYELLALVNRGRLDESLRGLPNVLEAQADLSAPAFEARLSSIIGGRSVYAVVHAAWPGAPRGSLLQADDEAINSQIDFGANVTVRLARALFNHADAAGGRFVAVGSTAGTIKPYLQMGVYSLGKACLEQTVRLLAPELARKKITANAVCPSFVPVGINRQATERQVMMESAATPLGRVCGPDDVAGLIRYLLSPEAAFVSGQTLALTGARL